MIDQQERRHGRPGSVEGRGPSEDRLWPAYATPDDLTATEAEPLDARVLPESTSALVVRAATRWPVCTAVNVLPDAAHGEAAIEALIGRHAIDWRVVVAS